MSSYLRVIAIKSTNRVEELQNLIKLCQSAGHEPPESVVKELEEAVVYLSEHGLNPVLTEYWEDEAGGYDVDLSKLPPNTSVLRVVVS
ncbi:MAG: hypothetical protein EKK48_12350 [Candidatus Melainabacteria bacterium]|nr:MAG: hypothetical protein EKK48_12350 [Candidatus Melainabacteria bacterium]